MTPPERIPPTLLEGVQRLVDQGLRTSEDRTAERLRGNMAFWPILVVLVVGIWAAFATYQQSASAKTMADETRRSIEEPERGVRATINALDKKVDVGFTDLRRILEERLPAKPPR